MAGYSAPLLQKLGIKPGVRMALVHPPKGFKEELGSLPEGVKLVSSNNSSVDFILLFVSSESELQKTFPVVAANLSVNGMLWIAWPKKSSGVISDLSITNVQRIGLDTGLV